MMAYIMMGVGATLAASIAFNTYQSSRIDTLKGERQAVRTELASCGARLSNLVEDIESDQSVDNLNLDNFVIPDSWLSEPATD